MAKGIYVSYIYVFDLGRETQEASVTELCFAVGAFGYVIPIYASLFIVRGPRMHGLHRKVKRLKCEGLGGCILLANLPMVTL